MTTSQSDELKALGPTAQPITVAKGQRPWARQLHIEGDITEGTAKEAKVLHVGGTVWILGLTQMQEL